MVIARCPSCGAADLVVFYEVEQVPAHSVLLLEERAAALNYPTGDIRLAFCADCGFITNVAFDAALHEYSTRYEGTQSCSPTFNAFARRLADHLVARYDLHHKTIVEIGCGQGEFLTLLCESGDNRGIGFDPAYRQEASDSPARDGLTFIADFYSERYADVPGDFICCKMTLEHIPAVGEFVGMVRRAVGDQRDRVVFFQVPNARRVLQDGAFWDVYYEHCSYFSMGSIARLFRAAGFEVLDLVTAYDDQYLMIEAMPGSGPSAVVLPQEQDREALRQEVAQFQTGVPRLIAAWRSRCQELHAAGHKIVLWGGGSKGVAFLTTLGLREEVRYVVDINPNKHGTFMAGTGQEIVGPAFLQSYAPDVVIVMNPIYREEVRATLHDLGVAAELLTVQAIQAARADAG
ncbi:MAG: methyltransferase domain-containing protein [Anaerolineae bacterium]|nr:methyltransferase domain-containing protein [Anaerolineae bacterium]